MKLVARKFGFEDHRSAFPVRLRLHCGHSRVRVGVAVTSILFSCWYVLD